MKTLTGTVQEHAGLHPLCIIITITLMLAKPTKIKRLQSTISKKLARVFPAVMVSVLFPMYILYKKKFTVAETSEDGLAPLQI